MKDFRVLDLFSGIGGFSLGLERTGEFETVAFCERDPKARRILEKHWPNVRIFNDITAMTPGIASDTQANVITGGFPCQDISYAGKGLGLAGSRSGLWWELHRIIDEVQPEYAIIENVTALRRRGLGIVLRSLAEIGYDAEWYCLPASAIGALHRRDRVWIVAYPSRELLHRRRNERAPRWAQFADSRKVETRNDPPRLEKWIEYALRECGANAAGAFAKYWLIEPPLGRVAYGISGRVDRLKQLGNAIVPQMAELLGHAILSYETFGRG